MYLPSLPVILLGSMKAPDGPASLSRKAESFLLADTARNRADKMHSLAPL